MVQPPIPDPSSTLNFATVGSPKDFETFQNYGHNNIYRLTLLSRSFFGNGRKPAEFVLENIDCFVLGASTHTQEIIEIFQTRA